jgi:hypothetical protein
MNSAHKANKQAARRQRLHLRRNYLSNIRDDKRTPEEDARLARVTNRLKELTPA